jgi:hypothetical protein
MAILQIVQTQHGVPALYWRLASVAFNLNGSCTMRLDGYFDDSARRQECEIMKQITYTVQSADMATVFPSGFTRADAYAYVKTQVEFSFGASDAL